MAQDCCTATTSTGDHAPVDLTYMESNGWTSPPTHCVNHAEAERVRDETNLLTPAAAQHRVWTIVPCACEGGAR